MRVKLADLGADGFPDEPVNPSVQTVRVTASPSSPDDGDGGHRAS